MPDSATGLLLLAAGASTRLGQPKQLLPYAGTTLLRHAATTALASGCAPIVAVLGADAERMQKELAGLPVAIIHNAHWEEGMASSLRYGVAALTLVSASIDAVAIAVCDQPFVTADLLRELSTKRAEGNFDAAVSVYASGAEGVPCVFARGLFPDLLELRGAEGAKQILRQLPPSEVVQVSFPEGDWDVDTAADWESLPGFGPASRPGPEGSV